MDVHEGQLLKLKPDNDESDPRRLWSYDLASDVAVTDTDGRGLSSGEIVAGSTIQIRKNKAGGNSDK